ncbi:MAG: MazG family protein [Actinobacteria bacterium]|nr:MazG family protein [Actinomycetota bacterium]MBO0837210.1 MazG family protein [Actinomycetota bacterium]
MREPGERAGQPAGTVETGRRLLDLVQVMDTLRRKCPWDARQTHDSLTPYLLEETYEAVDALTAGDQTALREELGDVLLQVMFHARVAQERTDGTGYTIDDVAAGIIDKLTRRHPHVFGDVAVSGADEVKRNWDQIKAAERAAASAGGPVSALDGVPRHQPALSLAAQLLRRAERAGAPAELSDPAGPEGGVSELGQDLFDLVNRARAEGLDAELELRSAALAYADRVRAWETSQRPSVRAAQPSAPAAGQDRPAR